VTDNSHTITRKSAADILTVSLRTLDRYVRRKSLTTMRRGRELYFDGKEITTMKAELEKAIKAHEKAWKRELPEDFIEIEKARQKEQACPEPNRRADLIPEAEVIEEKVREREDLKKHKPGKSWQSTAEPLDDLDIGFAKIRDELLRRSPEEGIYKVLFEKVDAEHKDTRKKLDMATFRLGTLEAQIKSMVPLIQYRKKNDEALALSERAASQQKDLKTLHQKLHAEMIVKRIYAAFLFFMTALIPLLLILRFVNSL
jgi:hypothetical protein